MNRFFTRERFGTPQFLGGLLLLALLAQCVWLAHVHVRRGRMAGSEEIRIHEGLAQWQHGRIAGSPLGGPAHSGADAYDPHHSPLWYLAASAPLVFWPAPLDDSNYAYWGLLDRVPFLVFSLLLGASLWYVARRLYGNAGGYIALILYCFSPGVLRTAAVAGAEPEIGGAWGAYGAVFTAIAVAHTLYAPREVVLWNWRRIVMLGIALALAVGTQFSLVALLPLVLGFLLYLAPERRRAAFVIWIAGSALALLLLCVAYFFHLGALAQSFRHARFLDFTPSALALRENYARLRQPIFDCPALLIALPVTLATWLAWPRARYFGNTAPLLVALLCLALALGAPHYPGQGFLLVALPFLFTFVAGVFADLLETRHAGILTAALTGLLAAFAVGNVLNLARLR